MARTYSVLVTLRDTLQNRSNRIPDTGADKLQACSPFRAAEVYSIPSHQCLHGEQLTVWTLWWPYLDWATRAMYRSINNSPHLLIHWLAQIQVFTFTLNLLKTHSNFTLQKWLQTITRTNSLVVSLTLLAGDLNTSINNHRWLTRLKQA